MTVDAGVPDDVTLYLDPGPLRLALSHLVENAIEHNDRQEPRVEVTARLSDGDDWPVVLRVADDGPGILTEERTVVESGEETPFQHGSGVGLWAVAWAVTRLGGDLAFEENEPRGTVVEIRFPSATVRSLPAMA